MTAISLGLNIIKPGTRNNTPRLGPVNSRSTQTVVALRCMPAKPQQNGSFSLLIRGSPLLCARASTPHCSDARPIRKSKGQIHRVELSVPPRHPSRGLGLGLELGLLYGATPSGSPNSPETNSALPLTLRGSSVAGNVEILVEAQPGRAARTLSRSGLESEHEGIARSLHVIVLEELAPCDSQTLTPSFFPAGGERS